MQYDVLYDVLDDGWPLAPLSVAGYALLFVAAWLWLRRRQRTSSSGTFRRFPWLLLGLGVLVVLIFAAVGIDALVQHRQCREWARAGQYEVLEGTVSEYVRGGKTSNEQFQVGDWKYSATGRSAAYRGQFTTKGATRDALHNGLRVRIAHRDGHILRLEIQRTRDP